MENQPKKSKALIITIIIILLLLIAGFFIYQNRDTSDIKTSSGFAKIFSVLIPSKNPAELKTIAQAGEDIKKGDCVSTFGTGTDNNPIVIKSQTCNSSSFGTAGENITSGSFGEIITNNRSNNFWDSISNFVKNITRKDTPPRENPTNEICGNGGTDYPTCTPPIDGETIYPTVAVTATPSSIAKGGSSTITWTSANAKACTLSGGELTETGIENTTGVNTGALTTSTTYTVSCTGDNGLESSDNVFVEVEGSKIPDLVADRVTPESAVVNTSVTLSSVIRNIGNGSTNTDFSGYFNINSVDDNYTKSFTAINISPLTGGGSKVVTIPFTFRAPGTYSISVCADQFSPTNNKGSITESSEKNNCSDITNFEVTEEGGGGPGDGETIYPTVAVTATPSTIPDGGISTISWISENTNDCDAGSADRGTGTSGSFSTGRLLATTSYTVTCTASRINGTGSGNVVVQVGTDPSTKLLPTVTVTTNKAEITNTDDGATITWSSTNATKCNANNPSRGTTAGGDFPTGRLMKSTMYTVTCTGLYGSRSASVFVKVTGSGGNGEGTPDLIANRIIPTSVIIDTPTNLSSIITNMGSGGTMDSFSTFFTITKNNTNKDSVATLTSTVPALESKIGGVAVASYSFDTIGEYLVRACADKNSATDGGKISELDEGNNCGVETIVTASKPIPTPNPNDSLSPKVTATATPSTIPDGGISTISWTSENTNDCDAGSADRGTGTSGSFSTGRLPATTSYTVTCTASRMSGTASDSVTVFVNVSPNSGNTEENKCLLIEQNPLTFTQEEKARLAVLLRKFYLISSTLKTADDITTIYNEIDQQKNFVTQIKDLTTQCYAQIGKDTMINTDWVRHGNPWYSKGATGSFPYSTQTGNEDNGYLIPVNGDTQNSATERILNIW